MSEKMKDGKWYVPKDLGIVKATEEQGGTYYRMKDVDGKDRWIPAEVFKRKYQAVDEPFLGDDSMERVLNFYVGDAPKGVSDVEFKHFKEILKEFGKNLLGVVFGLGKARKEDGDGQADCAAL